jgi:hypothetical protein
MSSCGNLSLLRLPLQKITLYNVAHIRSIKRSTHYFVYITISVSPEYFEIRTVGGQIKLGHLKFNQCKLDH